MPYNPASDPHAHTMSDAATPARRIEALTPSDSVDLAVYAKSLRIWVPTTMTSATIEVTPLTADEGASVTLTLPPGLSVEPLRIRRLWASGTTAGITVHGYMD